MNIELLNMIGTWAGPVVTVAGFAFIWTQLRAERKSLETQTSWQVYETSTSILNVFVEYPEVRPYFYDQQPLPAEEPLRSRVLATVELFADHLENIVLSREALDPATYQVWVRYMQGLYRKSPALRGFLAPEQEGYRYSETFLGLLQQADVPGLPVALPPVPSAS